MLVLGSVEHYDDIKRMALAFFAASPYNDQPVEEGRIEEIVAAFLAAPRTEKVIILWCDPNPVGLLAGVAETNIFNYNKFAGELIWWIDPEHRKTRAAEEMRAAYEYWAKKAGCTTVTLVDLLGNLGPYYRRKQYEPRETTYIKAL